MISILFNFFLNTSAEKLFLSQNNISYLLSLYSIPNYLQTDKPGEWFICISYDLIRELPGWQGQNSALSPIAAGPPDRKEESSFLLEHQLCTPHLQLHTLFYSHKYPVQWVFFLYFPGEETKTRRSYMSCLWSHNLRQIWDSKTGLLTQSSTLSPTASCTKMPHRERPISECHHCHIQVQASPGAAQCPCHKSPRKWGAAPAPTSRCKTASRGEHDWISELYKCISVVHHVSSSL